MVKDMSQKRDNNQTALAGEFAVLSQLALHGFNAVMTLGNTKNIDILIYYPEKKKYARIEVKTANNKATNTGDFGKVLQWERMDVKHEHLKDKDLFYCFVSLNNDTTPAQFRFFVVPSRIVADYVKREHEFWMKGKPLRGDTRKENRGRSFRLGFKGQKYKIDTPIFENYENKWSFLS